MQTKLFTAMLLSAAFALTPASAQTAAPAPAPAAAPAAADPASATVSKEDLELLRQDLRAGKKKVTAEALVLTEAEGAKFWPVYDRYITELTKINDSKYGLIKEYTDGFGRYNDAQANSFIRRWLEVDVNADKLRLKYVPVVAKVLPGVKAASFFQIDRRLAMLVNLQLASELPILQTQSAVTK